MWVPKSEEEIDASIDRGDLEETHTLEFKGQLDKNSKEMAKDICAMTVDGGVIIYGIGEDDNAQFIRTPIPLKGQPERIDQIIGTGIHERPAADIKPIPTKADPSVGYIVVAVPPSPRAPHMVIARNNNRYYGRADKTVYRLEQGQVERLYRRRLRLEQDRAEFLDQEIRNSQFEPRDDLGYLHLTSHPLFLSDDFLDQALAGQTADSIYGIMQKACKSAPWSGDGHPKFYVSNYAQRSYGKRVFLRPQPDDSEQAPDDALNVDLFDNGSTSLFFGQAAHSRPDPFSNQPKLIILEEAIAFICCQFLNLNRLLLQDRYFGPLDLGVAVT